MRRVELAAAVVLAEAGLPEAAEALLLDVEADLDGGRDPAVALAVRLDLAWVAIELGSAEVALSRCLRGPKPEGRLARGRWQLQVALAARALPDRPRAQRWLSRALRTLQGCRSYLEVAALSLAQEIDPPAPSRRRRAEELSRSRRAVDRAVVR